MCYIFNIILDKTKKSFILIYIRRLFGRIYYMINRENKIPLYIQLANKIRNDIECGNIKPGDKLMSENEMVNFYQIGRLTIRQALSVLVNEGLLSKQHGRGTYCTKVPSNGKKLKFDLLLNMSDVYFIPYYLRAICKVFEDKQCDLVINDTKNNNETIAGLINEIISKGSDGVIVQPCTAANQQTEQIEQIFNSLIREGIPYIMLDGTYLNIVQSYVVFDEFEVGFKAADYLIKHGHKNMCVIHNNKYSDSVKRTDGFIKRIEKTPYMADCSISLENSLTETLNKNPDITALFCYNDLTAKECLEVLKNNNYSVPDDISVISVDDTVIAATVTPSLTSVAHPKGKLGEAAAAALYDITSGKIPFPYTKVFKPHITERNSVKNIT